MPESPRMPWMRGWTPLWALTALGAIVLLGLRLGTGWPRTGESGAAWGRELGRTLLKAPRCAPSGPTGLDHNRPCRAQREPDGQKPPLVTKDGGGSPSMGLAALASNASTTAAGDGEQAANPVPALESESPLPSEDSSARAGELQALDSLVPPRIRVQTESGRVVAASPRDLWRQGQRIAPRRPARVPAALVYTDEPFRPETAEEMSEELLAGPFAGFHALRKGHYLVLYQSTETFAEASLKLLEDLYKGLTKAIGDHGISIHRARVPPGRCHLPDRLFAALRPRRTNSGPSTTSSAP